MKTYTMLFAVLLSVLPLSSQAQKPMKLLVHVTTGVDNPTRAALAFLVARTAADDGHLVTMFLAGDGAELITDKSLNSVVGKGTGKMREAFDGFASKGGKIMISGGSAKAREITDRDIAGKPAQFATPNALVKLIAESDKVIHY
jgi:predicted peroxiredoxin